MQNDIDYIKPAKKSNLQFSQLAIKVYLGLMFFNLIFIIYNFYNGLIYSVFICLLAFIGHFLSMYYLIVKKKLLIGTYIVYFFLGISSVLASYFEGLMSGHFWFLFAMLFAIPFVVKREYYFKKQTSILYGLTILLILMVIIFSPVYSEVYTHVTVAQTHNKFILISTVCFISIMLFSFQALSFGKYFIIKIYKEKKRAENEKESRTRVLSNLGHELRTQINGINSVMQLILENDKKSGIDENYVEILDCCNSNMLFLVNDMLDMHKIESGKFELLPKQEKLETLLSKIIIPFTNRAEEKNLVLISNIDNKTNGINVFVDGNRLTQVLHNLISNAIKFTNHGYIEFSVEFLDETDKDLDLRFTVKDSGIGISSKDYEKIFDSFQQIKSDDNQNFGGTGLGLAISKTIIEVMGSSINVKSEKNKGTSFSFKLKLEKCISILEDKEYKKEVDDTFLINSRILVAEDNAVSLMYASKILKNHGAKVYEAVNGEIAVKCIEENEDIQIVLLDLEMPVMNGFKAIKLIKKHNPELIVIAFTANIPSQIMIKSLIDLRFDDIISKPFNKADMFKVLKKYININNQLGVRLEEKNA